MEGGTIGCFVPPLFLLCSWFSGSAWNPTPPPSLREWCAPYIQEDKTCAVLVKKELVLHQTFIKSVPGAVKLHNKTTHDIRKETEEPWFVTSLSNHGARQCVTLGVILRADQTGWTHGRVALIRTTGGPRGWQEERGRDGRWKRDCLRWHFCTRHAAECDSW